MRDIELCKLLSSLTYEPYDETFEQRNRALFVARIKYFKELVGYMSVRYAEDAFLFL